MRTGRSFAELWQEDLPPLQSTPVDRRCDYAQGFTTSLETRLGLIDTSLNQAAIAYKQWLLQESYHEYRHALPAGHRDYMGKAHECVYHVYLDYYAKLKLLALQLPTSNPFTLPEPRIPKRKKDGDAEPRLDHITLGELIDPPDAPPPAL